MRRIWLGVGGIAILAILAVIMFGVSAANAAPAHNQAITNHTCKPQRTIPQEKAFLQAHGASDMSDHLKSVTFACPGDASVSGPHFVGHLDRVVAAPAQP